MSTNVPQLYPNTLILQNSATKARYVVGNLQDTSTNKLFYRFDALTSMLDFLEAQYGEYRYWLVPMPVTNLTYDVDVADATFTSSGNTYRVKDVCVAQGILKYVDNLPSENNTPSSALVKKQYYERNRQ